jgi:hypothetical protein
MKRTVLIIALVVFCVVVLGVVFGGIWNCCDLP